MNFLETILARLAESPRHVFLQEVHDRRLVPTTGAELLAAVARARVFLRKRGLRPGQRCALIGANSATWVALDLAIMSEGALAVPLYARQTPPELAAILQDCTPELICCGEPSIARSLREHWPSAPAAVTFQEVAGCGTAPAATPPIALAPPDPVTIIYTSGTSGEAKGVLLTAGNLTHMITCTMARLSELMGVSKSFDRVFHYLPLCFAGSWIMLLTSLTRCSELTLSMNLDRLAEELAAADPHYTLNVPEMLERMRRRVEAGVGQGSVAAGVFSRAWSGWRLRSAGEKQLLSERLCLALARVAMFPAIRRKIGPGLRGLICGSAALAPDTQEFFEMLGLPVLQVYGLTETTAICTMDVPGRVKPGCVGRAIPDVEMRSGPSGEILVRGPNVFAGYWQRPQQTAAILHDGWLHTGDIGEVGEDGNWRILGRLKNLIVLSSGHNVAPDPIEDMLLRTIPGARQVLLVGDRRSFLSAIITGEVESSTCAAALERINPQLPHYKRIRRFHVRRDPFTVESGLVTANGKLRRELILDELRSEIEAFYRNHGT